MEPALITITVYGRRSIEDRSPVLLRTLNVPIAGPGAHFMLSEIGDNTTTAFPILETLVAVNYSRPALKGPQCHIPN